MLQVFEAAATDLVELTDSVTSHISFCVHSYHDYIQQLQTMVLSETQTASPEDAYSNGNKVLYNQAKTTLTKEIRVSKRSYSKKLENDHASV